MAYPEPTISTPLLAKSTSSSDSESSLTSNQSPPKELLRCCIPNTLTSVSQHKSLAILSGHVGSVSCLALCGEFLLSASHGKDIIAWQKPDLRRFTKFGHGDGSVKAPESLGNRVFSANQDGRIRVWMVSRSSENIFRLTATLPTTKDYLCKFMKQSN